MVNDRVAKELRAALDSMRGERDQLDKQISAMEALLTQMGAPAKRGPGRPKASAAVATVKRGPGRPPKAAAAAPAQAEPTRRGPGRPKGSKNKGAVPAKRGPGRPKKAAPAGGGGGGGGGNAAATRRAPKWSSAAREAARARMKAYWAERRKNQGK
jgi:hypothetical protein